jgi:hypothetical protein
MKAVYQDVWDADEALRTCTAEGLTFAMGSTTFLLDALVAQRRRPRCGSSAAPAPPSPRRWCTRPGSVSISRSSPPGHDRDRCGDDDPAGRHPVDVAAAGDGIATRGMQVRVIDHLQEAGMAGQFWPEPLDVVAEMPKTPSGKIQKFVLRPSLERLTGAFAG